MKTQMKIVINKKKEEEKNFNYSLENFKQLPELNYFNLKNNLFQKDVSQQENMENNYNLSDNDFSEIMNSNMRSDECSDDDYSSLKKEIDSYINAKDDMNEKKDQILSNNLIKMKILNKDYCKILIFF
jgi:hypothetical protein